MEESTTGISENWGSAVTAVALSMPSSGVVLPFFFLACSSCHHLGYPCYLKHVSRVCLVFSQCVHFPPIKRSLWFRGWVMLSHYQHWWLAKSLAFDDHNSTTSYGFCPCCHHCLSSILSSDTSISPLNCRKRF